MGERWEVNWPSSTTKYWQGEWWLLDLAWSIELQVCWTCFDDEQCMVSSFFLPLMSTFLCSILFMHYLIWFSDSQFSTLSMSFFGYTAIWFNFLWFSLKLIIILPWILNQKISYMEIMWLEGKPNLLSLLNNIIPILWI